jgi:hypothetical protein
MAPSKRWPDDEFMVIYPSAGKINTQNWALLPKYLNMLVEDKANDILSMIADATAFRHSLENDLTLHKDPGHYYLSLAQKLRKILLHPCWYTAIEDSTYQKQKDFEYHYEWMRKRENELCESCQLFKPVKYFTK